MDWSQAPDLDRRDASLLYEFLTRNSDGAIVFDDLALRSWAKSDYAFPERMRDALVLLARSAVQWRELDGEVDSRR